MIKVDLIYSNYLNSPDGASRFVKMMKGQKELFEKYGINLQVITPDLFTHKDFKEGSLAQPSLFKRIIRALSKYSVIMTRIRLNRSFTIPANSVLDYYEQMDGKGDVIAFQESYTAYYFLKRRMNKAQKILLTMHNNGEIWSMAAQGLPRLNSILMKRYRQEFDRTLFEGCDRIGFVANAPRQHFCELYPYDEKKTFFCYNGVKVLPCPERENPDTLDLICVGSVNERKNQIGVLNAIGMLPHDIQDKITFRVVGDGTSMPLLKEKAKELYAKTIFVGNSNEVEKQLQQANCFILFSKDEGLPISIIEGMRSGLPIIGTKIAGVPEQIIDGKNGFLINVNEKQLADKLFYLVNHLDVLESMGKASYGLFLEKFTLEAMVKKYSDLYRS